MRGAAWAPASTWRAASMTSPSTAVAVGSPPAPGPANSSSRIEGPATKMALVAPRMDASGWSVGIIAGWTLALTPSGPRSAMASNFTS